MKELQAGEMFGFQIVNRFPESSTDEEWTEFAENMAIVLGAMDNENVVSA